MLASVRVYGDFHHASDAVDNCKPGQFKLSKVIDTSYDFDGPDNWDLNQEIFFLWITLFFSKHKN